MSYNTERPTMDELVAKNASAIKNMNGPSMPVMVPIQEKDWDTMVDLLESTVSFQPKLYSLVKQQLAEEQMIFQSLVKQIKDSTAQMATGWEESRKEFERFLGKGLAVGNGYRQGSETTELENLGAHHRGVDTVLGAGGSAVRSAMYTLAALSDDNEDPEERRKRIEAQENGEALGALLGLAAGAISEIAEENDDEFDHKFK